MSSEFSAEGIASICSELQDLADLFAKLEARIHEFVQPIMDNPGLDEFDVERELNGLIDGDPGDGKWQQRLPRKQEQIVAAFEVMGTSGSMIVFESDDGCLWQLGSDGLAWYMSGNEPDSWTAQLVLMPFLPMSMNPRPSTDQPLCYDLQLRHGRILRVTRSEERRYRYEIVHPNGIGPG